jgi:hypothetical protein
VSPRVQEESVHPRLLSGACVRPLNFTVRRPEARTNARYISRLEKLGAPPWVRGLGVVVLAVGLMGNLVLITVALTHPFGTRHTAVLAVLWVFGLAGLAMLVQLWKTMVTGSRATGPSNNRWRGS